MVLPIVVSSNWEARQFNVKNVFLHGFLQEEVYMSQPLGFIDHIILSMYVYLKSHRMVLNKHQDPGLICVACISYTLVSFVVRLTLPYLLCKVTKAKYFSCYLWMILLSHEVIHLMSQSWFYILERSLL